MKKALAALGLAILTGSALAAAAAPRQDGANIRTSGSTNTQPYDVKVWSDGSAAYVLGSAPDVRFTVAPALATRFFADVRAARSNPGTPGHCMKSASFGTSTVVAWHDYTSVDLQCPPFSPEVSALNADVREIQARANVGSALHRRIPLPREPVMAPKSNPTPVQMNPTPSPEVSPT